MSAIGSDEELNNTTLKVYQVIREKILEGAYTPDKKIYQNNLAEELGVSRTPVVKALHKLEMEGLVDNIPQKGFYIHQITLREMLDHFMLRQALEMVAASYAAEYASERETGILASFFTSFVNADGKIDEKEYYKADSLFHDYLISLCKNSLVTRIDHTMQIMMKTYTSGLLRKPEDTLNEHLQLIEAVRRHDCKSARILAMEHLEVTLRQLQKTAEGLSSIGADISSISINTVNIID